MRKSLLFTLTLLSISILINSCSKTEAEDPTPSQSNATKWSFSFDLNGKKYTASDISNQNYEKCYYDTSSKRLSIQFGEITNPELLYIKFPSNTVGSYTIDDNTNSYINYGFLKVIGGGGNWSGYGSKGDIIVITSFSNDNITGTFMANSPQFKLTNGIFKAENK